MNNVVIGIILGVVVALFVYFLLRKVITGKGIRYPFVNTTNTNPKFTRNLKIIRWQSRMMASAMSTAEQKALENPKCFVFEKWDFEKK
ncbi:hypothetical protein KR51_00024130 [Rubidibacter lacunae KORDI 51-2]|uniref:Uncharacterized protein n=1 Tax=Rubidibacter lacunae KORDI 51-2 TaxID=582515 RepID=U5DKC0_9CHRO|nr:hypothetical protein [Rubidibacter lacunae]ERN41024.1 hypothetical protein KR51_00024130 [Rubidibacter lacunae KORDI 51-2]